MITTIKNLTNKKLNLDVLPLEASAELEISWTKSTMTDEVMSSLINAYLNGEIDLINGKGKSVKKIKKKPYFVIEKKAGKLKKVKKTQEVDIGLRKLNKQFNKMMDTYLDD